MRSNPANSDEDMTDEQILQLVNASLHRFDPVPEVATRAAQDALKWRSGEADIALFLGESVAAPELAGVRTSQSELFEWRSPTIRVEGAWQPDGSLVGSVRPFLQGASLTMEIQSGAASLDMASDGRFVLSAQSRAVLRLRIGHAGGSTLTEWFVIDP